MDFSSALASLKRTASEASGSSTPSASRVVSTDSRATPQQNKRRRRDYHHSSSGRRDDYATPESEMQRALIALPHYRPPSSPPKSNRHIALLFITIDDLPFEEIWKAWTTTQATTSNHDESVLVSVIVHAKFPNRVRSEWLKRRLLVHPPTIGRGRQYSPPVFHSRRPEWGSIEITRAMLDLLHEGLKIGRPQRNDDDKEEKEDERFSPNRYHVGQSSTPTRHMPPVDKFIYVSETCLPVTTLEETATSLFGPAAASSPNNNTSWVNGRNTPNNGYSRQLQFEKVDSVIPKNCIWKADQWMVLSRPHAVAIMTMDRSLPRFLWSCFTGVKASDEMYFPTALSLLGIMPNSSELAKRRVTYAAWSVSARNPESFVGLDDLKRVGQLARREGCLFARKFCLWDMTDDSRDAKRKKGATPPGSITVEEWKDCIDELTVKQPMCDSNEGEKQEEKSST